MLITSLLFVILAGVIVGIVFAVTWHNIISIDTK